MERMPASDAVRPAFERGLVGTRAAGVDVTLDVLAGDASVRGDANMLGLLVENLMGNVSQHVRRGQRATLTLRATDASVELALADDGPAFGPPDRDFTRDGQLELKKRSDSRYSRGLALYLVGLIVGAMSGSLDTRSTDGKGRLVVSLPRA
jgi:K+-sensing histidine kinase KdpD